MYKIERKWLVKQGGGRFLKHNLKKSTEKGCIERPRERQTDRLTDIQTERERERERKREIGGVNLLDEEWNWPEKRSRCVGV